MRENSSYSLRLSALWRNMMKQGMAHVEWVSGKMLAPPSLGGSLSIGKLSYSDDYLGKSPKKN